MIRTLRVRVVKRTVTIKKSLDVKGANKIDNVSIDSRREAKGRLKRLERRLQKLANHHSRYFIVPSGRTKRSIRSIRKDDELKPSFSTLLCHLKMS